MHKLSFLTLGLFRFRTTKVSLGKQCIAKVRIERSEERSRYHLLCSDHFLPADYAETSKRPRLRRNSSTISCFKIFHVLADTKETSKKRTTGNSTNIP